MLDKFEVLRNAETYVVNRQFGKAIAEYRSLLESKGEDPALLNTLGDLLLKNNQQNDALNQFRRVAQIFIESGFTNKAIAVCKKIHKLDPSDRETIGQLADLYQKRGFQSQAGRYYKQLVEGAREAGRYEEAVDWQQGVLKAFPKEPRAFAEMAELNLALENAGGAQSNFVTASWLSFENGDYEKSVAYADEALSLGNDSEAALRLKEVAGRILVDGESILSDPACQLDAELFTSVTPSQPLKSKEASEGHLEDASQMADTLSEAVAAAPEKGETVPRTADGESEFEETPLDYSAVDELADPLDDSAASDTGILDHLAASDDPGAEPETEMVHELSDDIIDNDLQDVERLLEDAAQNAPESEQPHDDYGMAEGDVLGEMDVSFGGTVSGLERFGEILDSDDVVEAPTGVEDAADAGAAQRLESSGQEGREAVATVTEEPDEPEEVLQAAGTEGEAPEETSGEEAAEGLVGADEYLQEDDSSEEDKEPSLETADSEESGDHLASSSGEEDEYSDSDVVEIPADLKMDEESLEEVAIPREDSISLEPEEGQDIFEIAAEESAAEDLGRLEEAAVEDDQIESELASDDAGTQDDQSVVELTAGLSSDELSQTSVESLFEEAVSAEASEEAFDDLPEQVVDLDEIVELESTETHSASEWKEERLPQEELAPEELESVEDSLAEDLLEESVLDRVPPDQVIPETDHFGAEPKEDLGSEVAEPQAQKQWSEQTPSSFWNKLRDSVLGRAETDLEAAPEESSEAVNEEGAPAFLESIEEEVEKDSAWEVMEASDLCEGTDGEVLEEAAVSDEELESDVVADLSREEGLGEDEQEFRTVSEQEPEHGYEAQEEVETRSEEVVEEREELSSIQGLEQEPEPGEPSHEETEPALEAAVEPSDEEELTELEVLEESLELVPGETGEPVEAVEPVDQESSELAFTDDLEMEAALEGQVEDDFEAASDQDSEYVVAEEDEAVEEHFDEEADEPLSAESSVSSGDLLSGEEGVLEAEEDIECPPADAATETDLVASEDHEELISEEVVESHGGDEKTLEAPEETPEQERVFQGEDSDEDHEASEVASAAPEEACETTEVPEETSVEVKAVVFEEAEQEVAQELTEQGGTREQEPPNGLKDLWNKLKRTLNGQEAEGQDGKELQEPFPGPESATEDLHSEEEPVSELALEDQKPARDDDGSAFEEESKSDDAHDELRAEEVVYSAESSQAEVADESRTEEGSDKVCADEPVGEESETDRDRLSEGWKQPSVYADRPSRAGVAATVDQTWSSGDWAADGDDSDNGNRREESGSLEEALQEYDFNVKLGLYEEAQRLASQLLARYPSDERVLLRAEAHGLSPASAQEEAEAEVRGEATLEEELDSAFEDIFKMPGDEIPEDVLIFELDTADDMPSDESKVQFDLGLGYREMGLLDDAVEKFEEAYQVAMEANDQEHAASCCGMLAATYMELTDYRKVLEWADRGLGLHVAKTFEEKVLRYERAQALEMLGEFSRSLESYRILMEQDPAFRDVRARVGRLNLLSN